MSRSFSVQWSEAAAADLEELVDFLEREEAGTADAVLTRLESAAARLETLPSRGRWVPELARFDIYTYRQLLVRPWRLIYRVGERQVLVVGVLDGRRDLESLLLNRLLRRRT